MKAEWEYLQLKDRTATKDNLVSTKPFTNTNKKTKAITNTNKNANKKMMIVMIISNGNRVGVFAAKGSDKYKR